jgi:hypothetical protein
MHGHFLWCVDTQADFVPSNIDDCDDDIIANYDALISLS